MPVLQYEWRLRNYRLNPQIEYGIMGAETGKLVHPWSPVFPNQIARTIPLRSGNIGLATK